MKKRIIRILSLALAGLLLFSLCSCGKSGTKGDGTQVWYMGGNNVFAGDINVKDLFKDREDTVDPAKLYDNLTLSEDMLYGVYTLNNKEKDLKKVRKEIPLEEVKLQDGSVTLSLLPTTVYFGAEYINSADTNFSYSAYEAVTDGEVAVIEFAAADKMGHTSCLYELDGNTLTFRQIKQTSGENEPFTYEQTGVEFTYTIDLRGPYLTFTKGEHSLQLMAYCLTENNKDGLSMDGYSRLQSPLVGDLDYFASAEAWNYAVKRDGSYVDISAYKLDDAGRFTLYLGERDLLSGEMEEQVAQYAYILQSDASGFGSDFGVILLDGEKTYYYTDDIIAREARSLEEQGMDVKGLTEEEIKEIAEKKSDLFDDLYSEFEAQGINVTINRSNGELAMDASVLFGGDSAEITADGKTLLNKFVKAYTSIIYNEKYDGFIAKTMVEGHTAPMAGSTEESGKPLSQKRADNVKAYCLSAEIGVDTAKLATTLEAAGLSNTKPVYNSDGEIDAAACRRVSFRFIVNLEKQAEK